MSDQTPAPPAPPAESATLVQPSQAQPPLEPQATSPSNETPASNANNEAVAATVTPAENSASSESQQPQQKPPRDEEQEALKKSKAQKISAAEVVQQANAIKTFKNEKVQAEISIQKVIANSARIKEGNRVVLYACGNFSPLHNGTHFDLIFPVGKSLILVNFK